uniref:Morc-1 n=1 Tax=Pristionchus pacificus TaxID=54126 RepID=A0A2A6B691_PRIPA|eukprot:PDM61405.1 morc-1 [Pristionchus pacificus]
MLGKIEQVFGRMPRRKVKQSLVTAKALLEEEKAAEKKEKKKKEEKGKDVKEEWIPKSITEIKEGEKLRLRPLPMHLESLTTYFAATYRTKPREAEETVGGMLRRALSDQIPATGTEEAQAATTPMPYCRVCDLVFDRLDPFLDHINSEDHWYLKENDSMPLFDESAEGEELTVNQELAREFMSPALVDIREEDEREKEREKEEKAEEGEGNRSLVAEGEKVRQADFKLPNGKTMNLKVMSAEDAQGLPEEERKKWFKLAPGESRTIKVGRTSAEQGGKLVEAVEVEGKNAIEGKKEGAEGTKEEKGRETPKKEKLIGAILSSLAPKDIVGYRLRQRPCAECAAIWNEYGALIRTTTKAMAHEGAVGEGDIVTSRSSVRLLERSDGSHPSYLDTEGTVDEAGLDTTTLRNSVRYHVEVKGSHQTYLDTKGAVGEGETSVRELRSMKTFMLPDGNDYSTYYDTEGAVGEGGTVDEVRTMRVYPRTDGGYTSTYYDTEFAFRCHPIHPCVALLNVTMECFRTSLVEGDDEAYRIPSAHTIKVPSREQLKELTNDLELEVSVPLSLGDRHAYACTENYQVAMHFRADAMRKAYERFMDACYKRDEEGKPFCCEVCWVLLPSLRHFKVHMLSDAHDKKGWQRYGRHFKVHMLSDAHDKKMGKAPVRQSALYNPLGQMVCFIDAVTLLARKKAKKIEKKEERKEERKQREKRKEEQVQKPAPVVVKKEQEVDKDEKKKAKEEGQKPAPVVVKKEPEVDKEEKGKKEEREKGKEEDQQSAVARPVVKAVRKKKKKAKKEEKREEEEEDEEGELSAHTARTLSWSSSTSDASGRMIMIGTSVHSARLRFVFEEPHGHDGCPRDKKGKPFCYERTTIAALERKMVRIVEERARQSQNEMDDEVTLDCLQITADHIRANGTLHTSAFAGLAELIDNAVDSKADNVWIQDRLSKVRPGEPCRYITVKDDGVGMDRTEALKTILVGYSLKRADSASIGQFGNGLKSGSMRVGGTMLMMTCKKKEYTVLLISLKYLDTVQDHKCYVPVVTYTLSRMGTTMRFDELISLDEPSSKHKAALKVILQYSPFETEQKLHEFMLAEYPEGKTGTIISLSDLKRLENNRCELQFIGGDFVVENRQTDFGQYQTLSKWLQMLYMSPRVVIFIQGQQVRQLDVIRYFAEPRHMRFAPSGIELFATRQKEHIEVQIKKLIQDKLPLEQDRSVLLGKQQSVDTNPLDLKRIRGELVRKEAELAEYTKQISKLKSDMDRVTGGSDITLFFGMDVWRRGQPRIIFYSNGRRIVVHPMDTKPKARFQQMMGVVVMVNIPSTLLTTKQTREHFEIPSEFEFVVKKIKQAAKEYFTHVDRKYKTKQFWHDLSYCTSDADDLPALTQLHVPRKLFDAMSPWLRQCAKCGQFRQCEWDPTLTAQDTFERTLEQPQFCCEWNVDANRCKPLTDKEVKNLTIKPLAKNGKGSQYESSRADPKWKNNGRQLSAKVKQEQQQQREQREQRSMSKEVRRFTVSPPSAAARRKSTRSAAKKKSAPAPRSSSMNEPRSEMDPPPRGRGRNNSRLDINVGRRGRERFSEDEQSESGDGGRGDVRRGTTSDSSESTNGESHFGYNFLGRPKIAPVRETNYDRKGNLLFTNPDVKIKMDPDVTTGTTDSVMDVMMRDEQQELQQRREDGWDEAAAGDMGDMGGGMEMGGGGGEDGAAMEVAGEEVVEDQEVEEKPRLRKGPGPAGAGAALAARGAREAAKRTAAAAAGGGRQPEKRRSESGGLLSELAALKNGKKRKQEEIVVEDSDEEMVVKGGGTAGREHLSFLSNHSAGWGEGEEGGGGKEPRRGAPSRFNSLAAEIYEDIGREAAAKEQQEQMEALEAASNASFDSALHHCGPVQSTMEEERMRAELERLSKAELIKKHLDLVKHNDKTEKERDALDDLLAETRVEKGVLNDQLAEEKEKTAAVEKALIYSLIFDLWFFDERDALKEKLDEEQETKEDYVRKAENALRDLGRQDQTEIVEVMRLMPTVMDPIFELSQAEERRRERSEQQRREDDDRPSSTSAGQRR